MVLRPDSLSILRSYVLTILPSAYAETVRWRSSSRRGMELIQMIDRALPFARIFLPVAPFRISGKELRHGGTGSDTQGGERHRLGPAYAHSPARNAYLPHDSAAFHSDLYGQGDPALPGAFARRKGRHQPVRCPQDGAR